MTRFGLVLLTCCAASVAAGQTPLPGQNDPKPGKNRRSKIEIELPEAGRRVATPTTPEEYVQSMIGDLEKYPSPRADRAIDQLVLAGVGVAPALRTVLSGIRFEPKVGAAMALSRLQDADALDGIEKLMNDPRAKRVAIELLGALERIDPPRSRELAFRLAGGRDGRQRSAAFRYLRSRIDADAIPALQSLLGSRYALARREAFALLGRIEGADLTEDALRLIGDDDAQIAEAATTWLVSHSSDSAIAALLELAPREPPNRRSMWALVTLAELEEETGGELMPEAWIDKLDRRLDSLDPLVRVSAGLALAQIGFRSERDDVDRLLGARVLPALMETWLRNEFFKDFLPLFRMSKSRVRRITGIELGDDLTAWREAWTGGGGVPLIRRDLEPTKLIELVDRLIVRYDRVRLYTRGRDRTLVIAAEDVLGTPPPGFDSEGVIFVSADTMSGLVSRLYETEALEGRRAAVPDAAHEGYRRLAVSHDNRERSVVARDADDAGLDAVEASLFAVASDAFWQRLYVGPADGFAAFYHQRAGAFESGADPVARDTEYLRMLEVALPLLDRATRIDSLTVLRQKLRGSDVEFGPDELRMLLHGLSEEEVPEGPLGIVGSIISDRGDAILFGTFADSIVGRFGGDAQPLLEEVVRGLGNVDDALGDSRVPVQLAACSVAREAGGASKAALEARLADSDPRVVRAAILAMGRGSAGEHRAQLLTLAQGADPARRRIALEALGWEGSEEAFTILRRAVEEEDVPLVLAAYRGLARIGGEDSITVLDESIERYGAATQAGLDALDALADIGGPRASEVLAELLDSERPELREEAAYRLARLGDMRAVPALLQVLDTPSRAARAEDALALLMCTDGGDRGESFVQRWRDEPTLSAEEWFRRSLDLTETTAREGARLPLAVLLPAVRDARWYVRVHAIERLETRFGVTFGSPRRFASEDDVERLAQRWDGWLAASITEAQVNRVTERGG